MENMPRRRWIVTVLAGLTALMAWIWLANVPVHVHVYDIKMPAWWNAVWTAGVALVLASIIAIGVLVRRLSRR